MKGEMTKTSPTCEMLSDYLHCTVCPIAPAPWAASVGDQNGMKWDEKGKDEKERRCKGRGEGGDDLSFRGVGR